MKENSLDIKQIHLKIQSMKTDADELRQHSHMFPALNRNLERILANLKMLELNICDLVELNSEK